MTQEERDRLIALLLEAPDTLESNETEAVMKDEELREMYETAVLLKSAATPVRQYDVDEEWQRFAATLPQRDADSAGQPMPERRTLHGWSRWSRSRAASAIIMLSMGAVAATVTYTYKSYAERQETAATAPAEAKETAHATEPSAILEPTRLEEDMTFENATLAEIAGKAATAFNCRVTVADSGLASLRLYLTLPKGATATDFASIIDAYDALDATMTDSTICITQQQEGK